MGLKEEDPEETEGLVRPMLKRRVIYHQLPNRFSGINVQTKNNYLVAKFFTLILLISVSFLGACSTHNLLKEPYHGPAGGLALIVFEEVPFQSTGNEFFSFYQWIYQSFRSKTNPNMYLFDDKAIIGFAEEYGIQLYGNYANNNPKSKVINLGFDEAQINDLYEMAKDLGATHIIKARSIEDETTVIPKNQIILGPVVLTGDFSETTRSVKVEFTVYNVNKRELSFSREFWATATSLSALLVNLKIRDDLVSAVLAAVQAESGQAMVSNSSNREHPQGSFKEIRAEISNVGGATIVGIDVDAVENNWLAFSINFRNAMKENIKVKFKGTVNRLETYIKDSNGIEYYASNSSSENDTIDVKSEDESDFYFVFPKPALPIRQVDMFTTWEIETSQGARALTLTFKDVPLPE